LHGGDGNDILNGGSGNDILDTGAGGNFAYGGAGDDTYVFSGGNDVYDENGAGGTDTIQLPSGIDSGDLTFTRVISDGGSATDLLINVGTLGTIDIAHFFYFGVSLEDSIETLTFHDTSTLDLSGLTSLTTYGTDSSDTIYGVDTDHYIDNTIYDGGGDDYIVLTNGGNNTVDAGAGNDTIYGGDGNDTLTSLRRASTPSPMTWGEPM